MKAQALVGRARNSGDDCRRYMPVLFSFDSRAFFLEQVPNDDWDEEARKELAERRRRLREAVSAEFGITNGDQKFADFAALGRSSFSIVASHNDVVSDVRRAFVAGCYYSALVGATALGERILNDLVLRLREDYPDDDATKYVTGKKSFNDWDKMIKALLSWGVVSRDASHWCVELHKIRNNSVHYRSDRVLYARDMALRAMKLLDDIINHIFSPTGGRPILIPGTAGRFFISRAVESDPVVKHYFVPISVLVCPDHDFRASLTDVWDEVDYAEINGLSSLTDKQFADRYSSR